MLTELVELPGGSFRMGSTSFYPEEAPIHTVNVAPFAIERHLVTNAQFAEFVADTGYVTVAERELDPELSPGRTRPIWCRAALVFLPTPGPVNLRDWRQWWEWRPGACWRHPFGQDSGIDDQLEHPVVQVAYPDAAAYARWARRRLPSEAEWEYAARGGSTDTYPWGDDADTGRPADGQHLAGPLPLPQRRRAGWVGTSPVGTFPPNGFGLVDMIGNVWEWTTTEFTGHHRPDQPRRGAVRRREADPTVTRRSRAARTCARRSTATGTGRPRGHRSRRTARPRTSDSAAWRYRPRRTARPGSDADIVTRRG